MRAQEIRANLRREPFRAIRVYVSDGSYYDVCRPELMFVSRTEVVIGLDADDGDIPERSAYCDPVHITRIEPLKNDEPKRRPKRRK